MAALVDELRTEIYIHCISYSKIENKFYLVFVQKYIFGRYLIKFQFQGPPIIQIENGISGNFSLLPPNLNSASVTVLTQNVVLSTNLAGRWQRPDNSSVASNTLTFSTFYVTQGGLYKFYVDNWDGQQTLAIQLNIIVIGMISRRCIYNIIL